MGETRECRIDVNHCPQREEIRTLARGLCEYDLAWFKADRQIPLAVFLRDPDGVILGGLVGEIHADWLYVDLLWIAEPYRRQGYGSQLLAAAEAEARKEGCYGAFLNTFGFGARPFYEHHGYEVFGALENCPPGHNRFFLRKTLSDD